MNEKILEILIEKDIERRMNHLQNLTGKVDLKELCHLLQKAALFVGVDSGIVHLASSFDIPVVGIFGPTDPFYVRPQNTKSRLVRKEELECVPCHLKGCEERECMKRIETGEVFHACEEVLNR